MAGIDKCYISSYDDYKSFKDWAKDKSFTTPRGEKIKIMDWVRDWYTEDDFANCKSEIPIFNTPRIIDNYLYHNCPLAFIQEWLKSRYLTGGYSKGCPEDITNDMHAIKLEPCTKVKVIKKGFAKHPLKIFNTRFKTYVNYWWVSVKTKDDDSYEHSYNWNDGTNSFVRQDEYELWTCSEGPSIKSSIKSIIRQIMKTWKLPKGCIVTVSGYYVGDEWILETK